LKNGKTNKRGKIMGKVRQRLGKASIQKKNPSRVSSLMLW
jgi:hypothetical protein